MGKGRGVRFRARGLRRGNDITGNGIGEYREENKEKRRYVRTKQAASRIKQAASRIKQAVRNNGEGEMRGK